MKNILRQIYQGDIDSDSELIPRDKNYRLTMNKIKAEREYFKGILSQEDNRRLNALDDLRGQFNAMDCYANFSYGFRLAIQIMCECCGREENPEEE